MDELRESGATNMFGAAPYLQREFSLTKAEASEIVMTWMTTFEFDATPATRATTAIKIAREFGEAAKKEQLL